MATRPLIAEHYRLDTNELIPITQLRCQGRTGNGNMTSGWVHGIIFCPEKDYSIRYIILSKRDGTASQTVQGALCGPVGYTPQNRDGAKIHVYTTGMLIMAKSGSTTAPSSADCVVMDLGSRQQLYHGNAYSVLVQAGTGSLNVDNMFCIAQDWPVNNVIQPAYAVATGGPAYGTNFGAVGFQIPNTWSWDEYGGDNTPPIIHLM